MWIEFPVCNVLNIFALFFGAMIILFYWNPYNLGTTTPPDFPILIWHILWICILLTPRDMRIALSQNDQQTRGWLLPIHSHIWPSLSSLTCLRRLWCTTNHRPIFLCVDMSSWMSLPSNRYGRMCAYILIEKIKSEYQPDRCWKFVWQILLIFVLGHEPQLKNYTTPFNFWYSLFVWHR